MKTLKGLNEFLSISIILALSISAIVISIEFIKPIMEKSYDNFIINEAFSNLNSLSNTIKEISSESQGSKRTVNIKVTKGFYVFDENTDTINFTYNLGSDLNFSGYRDGINISTKNGQVYMFTKIEKIDFLNRFYLVSGSNLFSLNYDSFDGNVIKISIST
ncbi:MAG: hypothetical protein KQA41_02325 [Candidatus Aenigmarchaeota archaeon]|nr:hypothetical protein [Candidatus Aenigmarchaeota archaeon]MBU5689038.1 hypothetical protein [Candidatus Aenigmarchaeota archaeon]